jgi:hypothetical protein
MSYVFITAAHSTFGWAVGFITAMVIARQIGPSVRGPRLRRVVFALLMFFSLATLYTAWGHRRATFDFVFGLDHGLPYPDSLIIAMMQWFDARHPAPPGSLKVHGEFPRVSFVMGMLVFVGMCFCGFLAGVVTKRWVAVVERSDTTETSAADQA